MLSDKKPARVSIIPPPYAKGSFKIQTNEDGLTTATPTKMGKVDKTPSHVYDASAKRWIHMNEDDQKTLFSTPRELSPINAPPNTRELSPIKMGMPAQKDLFGVSTPRELSPIKIGTPTPKTQVTI